MTKDQYIKYARCVARISQRGRGLFWEVKTAVNELDPNFHQSWTKLRRFLCQNQVIFKKERSSPKLKRFFQPNFGDLEKKKVLTKIQSLLLTNFGCAPEKKNSTFLVQITGSPSQLLLPNPVGGAVFIFGAKVGLKSTKNVLFCILFRPVGGYSPPPPPGYATEICTATTKTLSRHLSDCWGYILIWRIQLAMIN